MALCHTHSRTQADRAASTSIIAGRCGRERKAGSMGTGSGSICPKATHTFNHTSLARTSHGAKPQCEWKGGTIWLPEQREGKCVNSPNDCPGRKQERGEQRGWGGRGEEGEEGGRRRAERREREGSRGEERNAQLPKAEMSFEDNSWIIENRLGSLDLRKLSIVSFLLALLEGGKAQGPKESCCLPPRVGGRASQCHGSRCRVTLSDSPRLLLPYSPEGPAAH